MLNLELVAKLFFFSFTLWLGTYLLARNAQKATVRLTGFGLLAYALALVIELLTGQLILILLLLPAIFWIGASLYLLPEELPRRDLYIRIWVLTIIPIVILVLVEPLFSAVVVLALFLSAIMIARLALRSHFKNTLAVLAVVGLFFGLSTGLMVLPFNFISGTWGISMLGADLILLVIALTV